MQIGYVLINTALLAVILYFAGRKSVVSMFRSRREQIDRELTEAETPLSLEPLPPAEEAGSALSAELAAAMEEREALFREQEETCRADEEDLRREMLLQTRTELINALLEKTAERMSAPENQAMLLSQAEKAVEAILRRIHLTPGDMSYITRSGRLYVTLFSATPLRPELIRRIRETATAMVKEGGGEISFWEREDPTLLGGWQLRIGDTIYDYTMRNKLYRLRKTLNDRPLTETDGQSMVTELLRAAEKAELGIDVFQVGRVITVGDGICWLDGLSDIMFGELVEFVTGQRGMVMDIHPDRVGCVIFGRYDHVESYSRVRRLNIMASVPVGESLLGRVVDALGKPIDGKGRIWTHDTRPIECEAPAIPDRQSVSVPLHTGIKAVDALVPIGRGQRELIIGDRQTGKTAIAIDTILAQKDQNVLCIYVAIGQKNAAVAEIAARLQSAGAMSYTTIISATASCSASLQYIAPFTGAALSEYFMYKGRDVLIVYDDLSKHAVAYRELSLLLHRPSGREAYPGDIFYLHSRLLERAARLSPRLGGGSVTALPIIETQAGDISAYIPTNVISITDGQIFLEADLFHEGQRPAVNVGLSVSRVGGAAQTGLMKQAAGHLRTSLAQYRELAAFSQFGADLDESAKKVLSTGERMMAVLRQDRYAPLSDWQEAALILAVANGFADRVDSARMAEFAEKLLRWLPAAQPELTSALQSGRKLDRRTLEALRPALRDFAEAL